ncbi:hypothetical protein MP638_001466 [Amoeboaphelidium occidentale]|nr:hypothetical protein MP638_001466 [Amoeboaphelidium occidentale]
MNRTPSNDPDNSNRNDIVESDTAGPSEGPSTSQSSHLFKDHKSITPNPMDNGERETHAENTAEANGSILNRSDISGSRIPQESLDDEDILAIQEQAWLGLRDIDDEFFDLHSDADAAPYATNVSVSSESLRPVSGEGLDREIDDDDDADDDDRSEDDSDLTESIEQQNIFIGEVMEAVATIPPEVNEEDEYANLTNSFRTEITREDLRFNPSTDWLGIPWERFTYSREDYRQNRVKQYFNYTNIAYDLNSIKNQFANVQENGDFYRFFYSRLKETPSVPHFQLRNLISASSRNQLYLGCSTVVKRWDSLNHRCTPVMDLARRPGVSASTFRITCICTKDDLLFAGGYLGEIAMQKISQSTETSAECHIGHVAEDEHNGITNFIDAVSSRSGATLALCSNNDNSVRYIGLQPSSLFKQLACFKFPFAVNCTKQSPDFRLLCVTGDSTTSFLIDARTGETIHELSGHLDYSFACDWSPDGMQVCTGNQDQTTRVYDVRNLSQSLVCLKGKMASVRGTHYSSDGNFLVAAEAADFVQIYDVKSGYKRAQVIDIFGEIAGVALSPDSDTLFISSADDTYGGIIELEKNQKRPLELL